MSHQKRQKPKIDKIEKDKRIRIVQEWIIDDWPSQDIIAQIIVKWGLSERQAKRYLADARDRWEDDEQGKTDQKRRRKILTLQKLIRNMDPKWRSTPAGIRAIVYVQKEIISLEGIRPATKLEVTGKDGTDLFKDKSDEQLQDTLDDILKKLNG